MEMDGVETRMMKQGGGCDKADFHENEAVVDDKHMEVVNESDVIVEVSNCCESWFFFVAVFNIFPKFICQVGTRTPSFSFNRFRVNTSEDSRIWRRRKEGLYDFGKYKRSV